MCCSNAAWKREEVPDHKFDFVNVKEFHATNCSTRLQYLWLYILVGKSGAVYIADIYTCVALLASNRWAGSILQSSAAKSGGSSGTVLEVPFSIGKWVFTGCILFSFVLLLWEARKARAIIKSRDISYAFTNVMSQNWYSLRSYDHFCFFSQINNSKKKKDEFAFFIFFTFKGWKRLILADAPRQVINAITLYSFGKSEGWTTDVSVYFGNSILRAGIIITMLFTLVVWVGSAILLLIAAVMYVPLLCYIQGNLKEYCCHKVDKRIAELMKRKTRKRLAKEAEIARKEARGDYSHLKDAKTGKFVAAPLPQPTLPKVGIRDEDLYTGSETGSIRGGRDGGNYLYPPSSIGYGGGRQGVQLQDRPLYAARQQEYSSDSLAGFATRGAPMGYSDSFTNVVDPGYAGAFGDRPGLQRGMTMGSQAPSYRSDDEKRGGGGGYYEDFGGDDYYGAPTKVNLAHSRSQQSLRQGYSVPPVGSDPTRQPSTRSQNDPYLPPSKQQLYERSARQQPSETSLGYAQDEGGGFGTGWEEQRGNQTWEQERGMDYEEVDHSRIGGKQDRDNRWR